MQIMCCIFGGVRFDLGLVLQGHIMVAPHESALIAPIMGSRGLQCSVNLQEIICCYSFGGVKFALRLLLQCQTMATQYESASILLIMVYRSFLTHNKPIGNHMQIIWSYQHKIKVFKVCGIMYCESLNEVWCQLYKQYFFTLSSWYTYAESIQFLKELQKFRSNLPQLFYLREVQWELETHMHSGAF